MNGLKRGYAKFTEIINQVSDHHVGAYAAQTAYFFMLCMIPIILLLLTLVRYTPITKADVMSAVIRVFPSSVESMITTIVNQVYNQSMGIIPVTILVALWSAGKGVLAITTGLNCIYGCRETRNYVFLRIRSTIYTMTFLLVIILLLVLSVFGNTLNIFIAEHIPLVKNVADWLIEVRIVITPIVLMIFSLLIYKFLPNRRDKILRQLPGAVFAAIGWMIVSWIFSVYVDVFRGFSSMYGSLTTIVLIMLWMYFCMYSILLGGEVNVLMYDKLFPEKEKAELSANADEAKN